MRNILYRFPLRYAIPAAILGFTALLGVWSYYYNIRVANTGTEAQAFDNAVHEYTALQDTLEYLISKELTERVQQQIGALGADPAIRTAILFDDQGKVIAALQRERIGMTLKEVAASLGIPDAAARWNVLMDNVILQHRSSVRFTLDKDTLEAFFPIILGAEPGMLRPTRVGILFVREDLHDLKAGKQRQAVQHVFQFTGGLAVFSALLLFIAHFSVARRMAKLISATRQLAGGDLAARSQLAGSDELAQLGMSFDSMAEKIAELFKNRDRAEEQVQRLAYMLEESLNEIYVFNGESLKFQMVNRGARDNLGYSMEELRALTPLDLKPEFTSESFAALTRPLWTGAQRLIKFITFHRRKDSSTYPVEVNLQLFSDTTPAMFVAIILDITERNQAEQALRASEAKLSTAMTMAHLGHWEYDVANDLFTFNDHFYAFLRTTAEREGGYTMSSNKYAQRFVHPDDLDLVGKEIQLVLETADPHYSRQLEHRVIFGDGKPGYVSVRFFIVKDNQDRTIKTYGVNQDITERKRAEKLLRENEERARLESLLRDRLLSQPGDEMYTEVLGILVKQFDSRFGFFGYIRDEDGALVCPSMTRDIWEVCAVEGKSVEFPRASWGGLWGRILTEHQPLLKNEIDKTPQGHVPLFRSMGAPLLVDGELIGSIHLANRATDYTAVDLALLTHLCSIIAAPLKLRLHRDKAETERNKVNKELQESERKYRELVENANSIILRWTCNGRISFINEFGQQFFGYTEAELLGQHVVGTLVPETESTGRDLRPLMDKICADPKMFEHNINENMRHNGERVWIAWTNKTIFDGRGQVKEVLSIGSDITERKKAENDRLRLIHDLGERNKELTALHRAARLLQQDRPFNQELLSELAVLLPPAWQYPEICEAHVAYADLEAATANWRETRWKQTAQFTTSDGQAGVIEVIYREDRPPAVEGPFLTEERDLIQSIADMLTAHLERRRAEDTLRLSEDHFRHLVNSSPSVIYATTLKGRKFIYVSETLTRMTGYEPQEMLTNFELWFSCVHPGDIKQTLLLLESQMQRGEGTLEYRFRKKDGEYLWINDNFRFIRDAGGKPIEVVGSWTDITASRRIEEQLAQAQKMEALGQLTGGIAHDFNNRLTVIMGNLELLQRRSEMNPTETDLIKTALLSADGAASLTRELLTFSRQQVLEFAVININDLITSMRNMLQRTLGETINVVISPESDLWPVRTDRHMLENVLLNLAINARDAMPNGGQLTFESHNVSLDETFVETHSYVKPGDYVLLSVSDTGQGMSEEIKRRVFEPFFTTKEKGKGTGLGLAMVYGFVKQSAGYIEIYSEPGHGTSFNIYLPKDVSTAVVDAPSPLAATGEEDAVIRDKTILLVEDDATVRDIVVTLLDNLGCRVLSADGGPAAMEIFAKTPDIDLLFTDITMPGGMTGFELAAKMRESVPELRVLYTSGYAPQAAADRRTIEHPNDFWLAKPYRFKTLKNLMIKAFGTQLTISGE